MKGPTFGYVRDPFELLEAAKTAGRFIVNRRAAGGGPDPLAFYVEQMAPVPMGGLPHPVAATIDLSNRHVVYAITWYGFAATLLVVYVAYCLSRLNGPRSAPLSRTTNS
jgi:cytochrome oxidase assembly protein ShyY1